MYRERERENSKYTRIAAAAAEREFNSLSYMSRTAEGKESVQPFHSVYQTERIRSVMLVITYIAHLFICLFNLYYVCYLLMLR